MHKVLPVRYRLRLLDACDSRTLSLSAWAVNKTDIPVDGIDSFDQLFALGDELPIWVLGTEQSLLPNGPAKVTLGKVEKYNGCDGSSPVVQDTLPLQGLLMQPGERYDALIDFTNWTGYDVYLINTGPDEPFKNFGLVDETNRATWETLGQLMKFDVSLAPESDADTKDVSTAPDDLCFDAAPGGVAVPDRVDNTRTVYLKEEVTGPVDLGPFAAVLDNVEDDPEIGKGWAKPITENIKLDAVEDWDIVNLSGK